MGTDALARRYRLEPEHRFDDDDTYVLYHPERVTSGTGLRSSAHVLPFPKRGRISVGRVVEVALVNAPEPSRADRLASILASRPTYILDRGYQIVTTALVATLFFLAFDKRLAPVGIAAVFLLWGTTVFADATVRGKSVFDPRVATIGVVLGFGILIMAIIGLVH